MYVSSKSNKEIETALENIAKAEDKIIRMNSFFYRILRRKGEAYVDEDEAARSLLANFKIIRGNPEAEFRYVSKNMLDPVKQFNLYRLNKLYGNEYLENLSGLKNSALRIDQFDSNMYALNTPGQFLYTWIGIPNTEYNLEKAGIVVEAIIKALSDRLEPKKEPL